MVVGFVVKLCMSGGRGYEVSQNIFPLNLKKGKSTRATVK